MFSSDATLIALLIMGMYTTPRVVTRAIYTLTTCKYTALLVQIPAVYVEVVCGTRECPSDMVACTYRSELICVPTTGMCDTVERHEVKLKRVGSHPRDNSRYSSYRFVLI